MKYTIFTMLLVILSVGCAATEPYANKATNNWPLSSVAYNVETAEDIWYGGNAQFTHYVFGGHDLQQEPLFGLSLQNSEGTYIGSQDGNETSDLKLGISSPLTDADGYWTFAIQQQLAGNNGLPAFDWQQHVDHPTVQSWIKYFETRGAEWLDRAFGRLSSYFPIIEKEALEQGVFPGIVALAIVESGLNPAAFSKAGAGGMWQFMRSTGRMYGLHSDFWTDARFDPQKSTNKAVEHLVDLYQRFGSWPLVFAAYNSGPRRVSRAIQYAGTSNYWTLSRRRFLPRETRNYVPKIVAISYMLNQKYHALESTSSTILEPVKIPPGSDLVRIALALELDPKHIARNNPSFQIGTAPPAVSSTIWLPTENAIELAQLLSDGLGPWITEPKQYMIRTNEHSPLRLQKKFGIPAAIVAELNDVAISSSFGIGDQIKLPVGAEVPMNALHNRKDRVVHRVKRGETLSHIARKYRTSIKKIRRQNGLRNSRIYPKQRLIIRETPSVGKWAQYKPSQTCKDSGFSC